jgi:hypothetical protein
MLLFHMKDPATLNIYLSAISSNIKYSVCNVDIRCRGFEFTGYCDHAISNMHFKKLHKMTKKNILEYTVCERALNSNLQRRSVSNF